MLKSVADKLFKKYYITKPIYCVRMNGEYEQYLNAIKHAQFKCTGERFYRIKQ